MSNKIYLIDVNGNHTIPVENEACIGREHLQNCEDKRISRKHATFTIEEEKVTITATHTNPIFYRTKSDGSLKSLLKNSIVQLQEHDEVGFLPNQFWFRISSKNATDANVAMDDSDTQDLDLNEHSHVEADGTIEEPLTIVVPTIRIKNAFEINQNATTLDESVKASWLTTGGDDDNKPKSKRPAWLCDDAASSSSSSKKQKTIDTGSISSCAGVADNEVDDTISVRDIPDLDENRIETSDMNTSDVLVEPGLNEVSGNDENANSKEDVKPVVASIPSGDSPDAAVNDNADVDSKEGIKEVNVPETSGDSPDGNDDADVDSKEGIKTSDDSPDGNCDGAAASSSSTTTTNTTPQVPAIKIKKQVKVEPADSSVRDSCQFGIKCYRRNPAHLRELAHPGDPDYRRPNFPPAPATAPDCPYGLACYRRNPIHFQQFRHPSSTNPKRNRQKLRKKNLDSGDSQLSNSNCVTTKRERKRLILKLDYGLSDDDDESDPFDDTDEDGEFNPSDVDDDTDDDLLPDTEDTPKDDDDDD